MLTVRCKECRTELISSRKIQFCGCSNQMSIVDDKIGAVETATMDRPVEDVIMEKVTIK